MPFRTRRYTRRRIDLGIALACALSSGACTRTQVGGGLIAVGAGAGYEGVGTSLGNRMVIGTPIEPRPEVGVPLILSGLLSGGIGISLVAMGDVKHDTARVHTKVPTPTEAEAEAASDPSAPQAPSAPVYPARPRDPWRSDPPAPSGLWKTH